MKAFLEWIDDYEQLLQDVERLEAAFHEATHGHDVQLAGLLKTEVDKARFYLATCLQRRYFGCQA
jgi:hypothetical protein